MLSQFPLPTTPRLQLRMLRAADIPLIVEYAGNPKIAQTTLNIPHPYQEKDAITWMNAAIQGYQDGTQCTCCVELRATQKFIGAIGLRITRRFDRAELGYWIAEPYWGQGFCTEAAKALVDYGFDALKLHKIYATHLVDNPASGRVMIKIGMVNEAKLVDHVKKGDKYVSLVQYRLTRKEYHGS